MVLHPEGELEVGVFKTTDAVDTTKGDSMLFEDFYGAVVVCFVEGRREEGFLGTRWK